jgi:cellulose biosynthesis protein BcsQ
MTIISVCSAKGAPGVTTLACALAAVWPSHRQVALAECDPSGGDLAAKFGISAKRGTTSLVLETRRLPASAPIRLSEHTQTLPGGLEVLAGPTGAGASRMVDAALPDIFRRLKADYAHDSVALRDLIVDCGRILPSASGQVSVLGSSDHVLVVVRPTVEGVASSRWIAESLNRTRDASSSVTDSESSRGSLIATASLVIVGNGPVTLSEVLNTLNLGLLGVVPDDRIGASGLRGEPIKRWRLANSALIRSANAIVGSILKSDQVCRDPEPVSNDAGSTVSASAPGTR